MPKKPIEWSKCIIYKIWKDDDFYVGSTTDFTSRKASHKNQCKSNNSKLYQMIRENGGWEQWEIIPLEEYTECQNKIQARIKEEEWRINLNSNLNSRKAFSINKEYLAQFHKDNIEKIHFYKNKKFECECGGKYTQSNKVQHFKSKKHQLYLTN